MRFAPTIRALTAQTLFRGLRPLLCASIGRTGSTVVYRALLRGRIATLHLDWEVGRRVIIHGLKRQLQDARFPPGSIHKTHDLPYGLRVPPNMRAVFMYGRPSDAVLSVIRCRETKGEEWIGRHFRNMHATGEFREIASRDVLRIGEQIEAWRTVKNVHVLGLKYEALWRQQSVLSEFVGFPVPLPDFAERHFSDMDTQTVAAVRATYKSLDEKVAAMPDYFRLTA